ncbi:MAG: V-type ATP synthase subunit I [Bacteroidales bacterium]
MLKYTFVAYHRDLQGFLQNLQELGVVDITQSEREPSKNQLRIVQLLNRYKKVLKFFDTITQNCHNTAITIDSSNVNETLTLTENLLQEHQQIESEKKKAEKDVDLLRPWGFFSAKLIEKLKSQGIVFQFFSSPIKCFSENWKNLYPLEKVYISNTEVYFVIAHHANEEPYTLEGAQEHKIPTCSVVDKEAQIKDLTQRVSKVEEQLAALSGAKAIFIEAINSLANQLQLQNASENVDTHASDTIAIFEGCCPVPKSSELDSFLATQEVIHFVEDIPTDESAPVLLKNNSFSKLFEVITKLYALPRYTEFDPTPLFAPFFMMFFGFCLGDGGYGLLLLLSTLLLSSKVPQELLPIITLGKWFGLATVVFGILSGTFFGINLVEIDALASIRDHFLNQDNMMLLSLIVGGVQILFGMCVKVFGIASQKGFKYAISQIATVVLILSSGVYVGLPIIGLHLSNIVNYFLLGALGISTLIFFFYNSPGKNPFVNFGGGLWNFYNLLTGLLGDMLSYIRLFALGLTGGILGGVFNSLAFSVYGDSFSIIGLFGMIFILLFGHSLNIVLSILGALVHPLRLTFVEFYKNMGFEGGGREYRPFEIKKQ